MFLYRKLEDTMSSKVFQVYKNMVSLTECAPRAKFEIVPYDVGIRERGVLIQGPALKAAYEFAIGNSKKLFERLLMDYDHIVDECGLTVAERFLAEAVRDMSGVIRNRSASSTFSEDQLSDIRSFMRAVNQVTKAQSLLSQPLTLNDVTSKIKAFCKDVLAQAVQRRGFRCIVFVERRCLARVLYMVVKLIGKSHPELGLYGIMPGFVTGHGSTRYSGQTVFVEDEVAPGYSHLFPGMSIREQSDMLLKFRTGQLNLLVSTSVTEEGYESIYFRN
jgi:ERCC4-related helicase